jgi:hypothetical protein
MRHGIRRLTIVAANLMLFMWSATALGQGAIIEWPPRDNASVPVADGRIRGRVVDAQSGLPLPDTQLRLTGAVRPERIMGTDDDGRFAFENLPTGRYMLTATMPGYLKLEYGQRRPFEPGKPIDLREKQTLDDVDFALPRGGVIGAHVTDEFGEPLSGAYVAAQRYGYDDLGRRRLKGINNDTFITNDRGEVRVFGLPPGDYYVKAVSAPNRCQTLRRAASDICPRIFPARLSSPPRRESPCKSPRK